MSRIRIAVGRIEERPELDPYRRDTGGRTESVVLVAPGRRAIEIVQRSPAPGAGTPMDEYHGLVLAGAISADADRLDESLYPLGEETRRYLRGRDGQALLRRICDGWEQVWDGSNNVGRLNADADAAWSQLQCNLAEYAQEAGYVDAGDWYQDGPASYGIAAATTDEQLAQIAEQHAAEAWDGQRVVVGGCLARLTEMRDELRQE